MAIDGRYFVYGIGEKIEIFYAIYENSDTGARKIVFDDVNDAPTGTGWAAMALDGVYTPSNEQKYQDSASSIGSVSIVPGAIDKVKILRITTASDEPGYYYGYILMDGGALGDFESLQYTIRLYSDSYVDYIPFNESLALELLALPSEFRPDTVAFVRERVNNAALRLLNPKVVEWSRANGWGSRITTACEDLMRWMLAEIIYPWDEERNKRCLEDAKSAISEIKIDTDDDGIPDTGDEYGQIDLIRTG